MWQKSIFKKNAFKCTNDFSQISCRRNVSVTDRRHCDDGPPGGGRDAGEGRVVLVLLDEVAERREDENSHRKKEKKKAKLFVAVLQRVGNGLEGIHNRYSVKRFCETLLLVSRQF